MDRLVAEKQTMTEQKVETAKETEVKAEAQTEEQTDVQSATEEAEQEQESDTEESTEEPVTENERYLNTLENITIADYMKREEDKRVEKFEAKKDALIIQQYEKAAESEPATEKKQEVSQNIIDKPNYDFIQENEKIVKLSKKEKVKKKPERKRLSLFLSIALGISAIICVSNIVAIDQMSSNLAGIEHEFYDVNLPKYLKDIADLDTTKKGMEFVETYPDEEFDAGQSGHSSNWFDKLCNFLSGLFGG